MLYDRTLVKIFLVFWGYCGSVVESKDTKPKKQMSPSTQAIVHQFNALAEKHPEEARMVRFRNHLLAPRMDASDGVIKGFWLMMVTELRQAVK